MNNAMSDELTPLSRGPIAVSVPTVAPLESADSNTISDDQFITELNRLRELRIFLNNEAVVINMTDSDSHTLGALFTLKRGLRGRSPTALEWTLVDHFNQRFLTISPKLK